MAITKVVPICLYISSEILDPHMEPLRKRQTGCFSMNYWFALHIPHIWLANSLECFFTFSFFSLPSFSVSGRVSRTNIRNHTNTYVPSLQYIFKTCPLNNNDDVLPFLWVNLIQFKTSKYFYNEVGLEFQALALFLMILKVALVYQILSETSGFWKWQITVVITR